MNLDNIVTDFEDASIPGQIGVAVGRAVSADKVQIINKLPQILIRKHPDEVHEF
jgi:hypothetical protein